MNRLIPVVLLAVVVGCDYACLWLAASVASYLRGLRCGSHWELTQPSRTSATASSSARLDLVPVARTQGSSSSLLRNYRKQFTPAVLFNLLLVCDEPGIGRFRYQDMTGPRTSPLVIAIGFQLLKLQSALGREDIETDALKETPDATWREEVEMG